MKTLVERLTSTDEGMRLFQQEKLILEFTELICGLLDEKGITQNDLKRKFGLGILQLDRILDGETEIDLRLAADLALALGKTLEIKAVPLTIHSQPGEPSNDH